MSNGMRSRLLDLAADRMNAMGGCNGRPCGGAKRKPAKRKCLKWGAPGAGAKKKDGTARGKSTYQLFMSRTMKDLKKKWPTKSQQTIMKAAAKMWKRTPSTGSGRKRHRGGSFGGGGVCDEFERYMKSAVKGYGSGRGGAFDIEAYNAPGNVDYLGTDFKGQEKSSAELCRLAKASMKRAKAMAGAAEMAYMTGKQGTAKQVTTARTKLMEAALG